MKTILPFLAGRSRGTLLMSLTVTLFAGISAQAATKTWNAAGSSSATTGGNWSPSGFPAATDEVLVGSVVPSGGSLLFGGNSAATWGNMIWNASADGSMAISASPTNDKYLILGGGAGFTAAVAAGGATGDLLLLGSTKTSGTFTVSGVANGGGYSLVLGVGTVGNFNVVNSDATLAITARIDGSSTITKTGAGVLSISSDNSSTFTGGLNVSAGTLLLNGGNVGASAVTVANGAILTGNGTTGSLTVQNGGILTPGNAGIGNLTASSVTLNATSVANFQVNGDGAGEFDTLTASGAISLDGTLNLNFGSLLDDGASIDLFLGSISGGTEFTSIVATGSYAGTFQPFSGSVVNLVVGDQDLRFDNATGILTLVAVPEPATAGMVAAAAFTLCVTLRRRVTGMPGTAR